MTRQEFIDGVTTWGELISFCNEYDIDACSDVYTDETKDDYVNEHLDEICEDSTCWQDVLSTLQGIPEGYDYYIKDEDCWMEFTGVCDDDDAFYNRKDSALEYMDEDDEWDDDEEQPVEDDDEYDIDIAFAETEEDDEFEADTDVSLGDFFASSAEDLNKITAEARAAEVKTDTNFNKFIQQTTAVSA